MGRLTWPTPLGPETTSAHGLFPLTGSCSSGSFTAFLDPRHPMAVDLSSLAVGDSYYELCKQIIAII